MEEYNLYVHGQQVVNLEIKNLGDEKLEKICAQPTSHIVQFKLRNNNLTKDSVLYIRQAKWNILVVLYLTNNLIRDKGCKYLSQTSLPSVNRIGLGNNEISSIGAFHLSKGIWKTMEQLYLFENKMCVDPVRCLAKADWPSLKEISIQQNPYPSYEAKNLLLLPKNDFRLLRFSVTRVNDEKDDFSLESLIAKKLKDAHLVVS